MAKKNMFEKSAEARQNEQEKMKQVLIGQADGDAVERTTMTLSMSVEDKMTLKMLAMKSGKTVSGMLHDWIAEHQE